MSTIEFNSIHHMGRDFHRRWDKVLYVVLDSVESKYQRLVCIAWPENDEQYPDRCRLLLATETMIIEPFVVDAISFAIDNGWTPTERGPDFVIQFDDGTFTVIGKSPV